MLYKALEILDVLSLSLTRKAEPIPIQTIPTTAIAIEYGILGNTHEALVTFPNQSLLTSILKLTKSMRIAKSMSNIPIINPTFPIPRGFLESIFEPLLLLSSESE